MRRACPNFCCAHQLPLNAMYAMYARSIQLYMLHAITVLLCTVCRCPRSGGRRARCGRQWSQLAHAVLAEVRSPRWSSCSGLPGRGMAPRRRWGGPVDRGSCHSFTSTKPKYAYMCMRVTSRGSDYLALYMQVLILCTTGFTISENKVCVCFVINRN